MFAWSALPDLSQHCQGKAAPSRLLLWPPAAPPLCCSGTELNLAVAWTGAKEGFSLHSCTRANALVREREALGYSAGDLEGQGMILPISAEVALPWGQAVGETTPTGQGPFLLCVMRQFRQCLNWIPCAVSSSYITIIYTVKSHEFNQLKGGGLGLPEGNYEVGGW